MRRALYTATVAVSLLFSANLKGDDDLVYERFGEYLDSMRTQARIPALAALIVGANQIVWERAFGRQDVERSIATRTDTLFHLDSTSQIFSAAMVLRCVDEGRLTLTDRADRYKSDAIEPAATLGQLMAHASESPGGLIFAYRPERLEPLSPAVKLCNDGSFRKTLTNLFDQLAMRDSIPGQDAPELVPPAEGVPSSEAKERYARALTRLAVSYVVDNQGRTTPSPYPATTLTPGSGAISTVRDLAQFDLALRKGILVRRNTLAEAWQPPVGTNGVRLPHGLGWFVQSYNGAPVVWQFGAGDRGSSSLTITLPAQQLTLFLLANSTGLVKPFPMAAGDVTVSPFGKLFLGVFGVVAR
jgi:CubicO group peptidase (beta-lactamase class C family)